MRGDRSPRVTLSPLQLALLRGAADGRTQAEVAAELHYSTAYAKETLEDARRLLGARTTTQAVARAIQLQLV